jgi:hypothetical protein
MKTKCELKQDILKLTFPFEIKDQDEKLLINYSLVDVKRKDLLGQGRRKETFKVTIKFKKEKVIYIAKIVSSDISFLTPRLIFQKEKFQGTLIDTKRTKSEKNRGAEYSYEFDPKEIKAKIRKVVEDAGWKFKTALF